MSVAATIDVLRAQYGNAGVITIEAMQKVLGTHALRLRYDVRTQKFTILGSPRLNKEKIEKIFAECHYEKWEPETLDEIDLSGNFKMQLVPIADDDTPSEMGAPRAQCAAFNAALSLGFRCRAYGDSPKDVETLRKKISAAAVRKIDTEKKELAELLKTVAHIPLNDHSADAMDQFRAAETALQTLKNHIALFYAFIGMPRSRSRASSYWPQ